MKLPTTAVAAGALAASAIAAPTSGQASQGKSSQPVHLIDRLAALHPSVYHWDDPLPSNLDVDQTPDLPGDAFVKTVKGINGNDALAMASSQNVQLPMIFPNTGKTPLCLHGGGKNLATDVGFDFGSKDTNGMVYVPAGSTAIVGNQFGHADYNGRVQAVFGCNQQCEDCSSKDPRAVAEATLFEYMYGHKDGNDEMYSNLSNVDGFNANGNVTVFDSTMAIAHQRSTEATLEQLKATCPAANLIDNNGFFGCLSECKQTNSDQHCCKDTYSARYGPMACPESSLFLKELAPKAYWWAYGDKMRVIDYTLNPKAVIIGFTPIV